MSKVIIVVKKAFVFTYLPEGGGDNLGGRERHFRAGQHLLLPRENPEDAVFLRHPWIVKGAEGYIDLQASQEASAIAAAPPPADPAPSSLGIPITPPLTVAPPGPPPAPDADVKPDPLADLKPPKGK